MTLGTVPDLLRLVAVPVFGYAAWCDLRTRRVPNRTWVPLAVLGVVLLLYETVVALPFVGLSDRLFLVRVGLSLGFVAPLAYLFWRLGGFGGADAKALMTVAVLLPTYPAYFLPWFALPLERTTLGVFSMTVLSNAVVLGLAYPLALGARNALVGDRSVLMFLGRRVPVDRLPDRHGRLFETRDGVTRSGLDLDALRMYLRWRGTTLDALRAAPDEHRDPASVGATRDPGDGAVEWDGPDPDGPNAGTTGGPATDGTGEGETDSADAASASSDAHVDPEDTDDPWAAAAFLDEIEGTAYGTTPATLREGLETVVERDAVWISPGIPFLVPTFGGLLVGFTYGDLLFGLLSAAGLV